MSNGLLIKQTILQLLKKKQLRFTPFDLEREVRRKITGATRHQFRKTLRSLTSNGQLVYTQHFSTTHLEINYRLPFQVSNRITLVSANDCRGHDSKALILKLQDGYAFGAGDHPTTRMVLRAIDYLLDPTQVGGGQQVNHALDIGTGTGILAIAAAGLGIGQVVGIDIDPDACFQAKKNVALNGYCQSISIWNKSLDQLSDGKFDLLMANLRPPTLRQLFDKMLSFSSDHSQWILSGFRTEEGQQVKKNLPKEMSEIVWEEAQYDWAAFAVNRKTGAE